MPCIYKHLKVVKAKENMQVLYIISYKKEQNLQLLHAISSYQLQYNKSSTLQEKLSSKGKYTNIALHKLHGTFAYTISFDSLGKEKIPRQILTFIICYLQRKNIPERIFAYTPPTCKVAEWRF